MGIYRFEVEGTYQRLCIECFDGASGQAWPEYVIPRRDVGQTFPIDSETRASWSKK